MSDQHFKEFVATVAKTLRCSIYQLAIRREKPSDYLYHYNVSQARKVMICHQLRDLMRHG
ncbi:hypothetical protein [Priestia flexa]|uniref:hypothetical protein n=1 Tax=Priestia flexa TaxID=86664 RepID=UPI001F4CA7C7|nr:hypothetical protein [Priestia flexa]